LAKNTVILFTSDHGEMMGDHGLSQKNCPYENAVRVPMILRWPGETEPGKVCNDLVGLTDFMPTLVEELYLNYPDSEHPEPTGQNLLGEQGGGLAEKRDSFVVDYGYGRDRWISIRTHKRKYVLFACSDGKEELYDLEIDPHETMDISSHVSDLTAEFRERVLKWERRNGFAASFDDQGSFKTSPKPNKVPSEEECRNVASNEQIWPEMLPDDEKHSVETFAEFFTRSISNESTLAPGKLSLDKYRRYIDGLDDGDPRKQLTLDGTPWEHEWRSMGSPYGGSRRQ
jgi:hypothetical protein